jgi:hypothetical protein
MTTPIQFRRGTASEWTAANPTLASGELGLESDTFLYKIGDGATAWSSLSYTSLAPTISTANMSVVPSDPSVPNAGFMNFYARSNAGRVIPRWRGPSGLDTTVQPAIFSNNVTVYGPGAGSAPSVLGGAALTAVGTVSHPAPTTVGFRESLARWIITSAAGANSASEHRIAALRAYRGDATGRGGFFFSARFGVSTAVANQRVFVGLTDSTSAISTSQSPSSLTNMIGVGWDSADTNLQVMYNDGSGTATKIDLGSDYPANSTTAVFEVQFFAAPNDTEVGYRVKRLDTGVETSGSLTTDLPSTSTFLTVHAYMNNGGTASAVVLELIKIYIETDN